MHVQEARTYRGIEIRVGAPPRGDLFRRGQAIRTWRAEPELQYLGSGVTRMKRQRLAPAVSVGELRLRGARAWRPLALPVRLRQLVGSTGMTDGDHRYRLEPLRHLEGRARRGGIEAGHLMQHQAHGGGLHGQLGNRHAEVVPGMAVGALLAGRLHRGHGQHQRGGVLRPRAIAGRQTFDHARERSTLRTLRPYKTPGLAVGAGRRPARGLHQGMQGPCGQRRVAERARAPAILQQWVHGVFQCRALGLRQRRQS